MSRTLHREDVQGNIGKLPGGMSVEPSTPCRQYSLEPILNFPGSIAFHHFSIEIGSTSVSGHAFTTRHSLSSSVCIEDVCKRILSMKASKVLPERLELALLHGLYHEAVSVLRR